MILLAVLLIHVFGESPFTVLLIICLAAATAGLIGSLEAIYRAALYVFASEGVVPAPFAGAELDAIWRAKPADGTPDPTPSEPPPDAPPTSA